jgi:para-aminobenzoate synthetase component 2
MVHAAAAQGLPVLGVCLGHQAIAEAFGAVVVRAPELLHGKTSEVVHDGAGVLAGLPSPFTATRYHSLAVDPASVPAALEVTGRTESGVVMALRHRELPIEGVQFHPESVLTEGGHRLLATWLATCGLTPDPAVVEAASAAVLTALPRGIRMGTGQAEAAEGHPEDTHRHSDGLDSVVAGRDPGGGSPEWTRTGNPAM